MKKISGGVCAAAGFKANGIHCGIRKNKSKSDLSLIVSDVPGAAAAVYTQNLVKGAPLTVTKNNISDGIAQAIICNSGIANTCCDNGIEAAEDMCTIAADALGIKDIDVIVASTGVIGMRLDTTPIKNGIGALVEGLDSNGSSAAAAGIMTTDTVEKSAAYEFEAGGATCRIGGIAKGSGMIHPNMATMLVFITSDVLISSEMLKKALSDTVCDTFNMISVDGDTSTNDMCAIIANGAAGNVFIQSEGEDYEAFKAALFAVMRDLSRSIAADGEGASKLLECTVNGAFNKAAAVKISKSVVCSSLTKAAMFGEDANWGRIICAVGYAGAPVSIDMVDITLKSEKGSVQVCSNGMGLDFSEELAAEVLSAKEIKILVSLKDGEASATAWGCDLTYDYVKINGDYRT